MNILEIAEIIGIITFTLSGFLIAVEEKLDILGVFIAAFLTAFGGGVTRDVIVGRAPFAFTTTYASLLVVAILLIAIMIKLKTLKGIDRHPLFISADTIGLVSFAISGAMVGLEEGYPFIGVILLSLMTAVGGGVMRDILINKIPLVLVSEFYGTVALVVGTLIFILDRLSLLQPWSIMIVFVFGLLLRYVARTRNWHLPKI